MQLAEHDFIDKTSTCFEDPPPHVPIIAPVSQTDFWRNAWTRLVDERNHFTVNLIRKVIQDTDA